MRHEGGHAAKELNCDHRQDIALKEDRKRDNGGGCVPLFNEEEDHEESKAEGEGADDERVRPWKLRSTYGNGESEEDDGSHERKASREIGFLFVVVGFGGCVVDHDGIDEEKTRDLREKGPSPADVGVHGAPENTANGTTDAPCYAQGTLPKGHFPRGHDVDEEIGRIDGDGTGADALEKARCK